jgi:uncharacterized cupredoxin-like copper-binding protein
MQTKHSEIIVLMAGFVAAVALVGCSGAKSANGTAAGQATEPVNTTITTTLKEFSITPSTATAKAGEVKFVVNNAGTTTHEFIVIKSDLAPDKLPVFAAGDTPAEGHVVGDVDEDKLTATGELDDINPKDTKDVTFKLTPGKYILLCNLPAHYKSGMVTTFTVQ